MKRHWSHRLVRLGACQVAIDWARTQPNEREAWRNCKRADWMLWLLGRLCKRLTQRRILVLAACDCAGITLKYVSKTETRPREAIRVARAWAMGKATMDEVRAAASYAYAASYASYAAASYGAASAAAAASAAYAASYASYASYGAAAAAASAASNAYAASYAAYAAAAAASHKRMVALIRKRIRMPRVK
jgi:hypothetical protein